MKQRLRRHWPLLAIVVLAILLRLPLLNGSFWMDEAAQALESARPWREQLQIRDDFQPPLLHLIVALTIRVDDSEWWLRTWGALIPGILTIVGTYFVALEVGKWVFKQKSVQLQNTDISRPKEIDRLKTKFVMLNLFQHLKTYVYTVDKSIVLAILTALLIATSSFHIFYSQELRQYSLPTMLGIWSWWVLIKMLAIHIGSRSWWGWGMAWVILSILGLYSSYLYPFLLLSEIIWIIITQFRQGNLSSVDRYAGHKPRHAELVSASSKQGNHSTNLNYQPTNQSNTSHSATSYQILNTICPWLHWLTLGLLIIIAFLPWLPSFIDQLNAGQMLRLSLPGWETVVSTPQLKALSLVIGKFLFGVADITPNPYFAIYSLLFIGLATICGYWFLKAFTNRGELNPIDRHAEPTSEARSPELDSGSRSDSVSYKMIVISRQELSRAILLILIAFLLPLLAAWFVSFLVPVLQPKRVLYLIPFWYLGLSLLISAVLINYLSWKVKIWPVALLGLLLFFNLGSTLVYWVDPYLQRENWRQAWIEINQTYGDKTPKLFLFDRPFASWAWYDRQYSSLATLNDFSFIGVWTANHEKASSIVERSTNQYLQPIIIYFDYLTDLTDPDSLVLTELEKRGYKPAEILDYPNIGFVRVFRK